MVSYYAPRLFVFRLLTGLLLSVGAFAVRAQAVPPGEGLVADTTELRVLRQFYAATGGPQWNNQTNWLIGTTLADVATWHGVGVANGDVVRFDLYSNNLRGALPASLGELRQLQNISLPVNQLTGGIPASVGQLRQLRGLYLWQNQLSAPLPAALGQLDSLRVLSLQQNAIGGPIPGELGQLTRLETLNLGANQLTGTIPPVLGQLRALHYLDLYANHLSGSIPASLGQLRQLDNLLLAVNELVGPLPPELGQLAQLQRLDLWQNNFQDSIPAAWGQLHQLHQLNLNQSALRGHLPVELVQLTALRSLSVYLNQLTGSLPAGLSELPQLVHLEVEYNQLSGPLPTQWTASLQTLRLGSNCFSGPLPAGLTAAAGLVTLRLGKNQLTGGIPPGWGRFTALTEFWLGQNRLTGSLPDSLAGLKSVTYFDVSNNQLAGPLPDSLGSWPALGVLYLQQNAFSGPLPASLARNANLSVLNAANNRFTGEIPSAWAGLTRMLQLDLSANQLRGSLAPLLGMRNLNIANLSNNRLDQPLPAGLGQLPNLGAFYADNNRMPGPLPAALGQAPRLSQLTLANNRLSGTVPASVLRAPLLKTLYLQGNEFTSIEDLDGATNLPALGSVGGNRLDFASLERLYAAKGQSRFAGIWYNPMGMDARGQRPLPGTDTVRFQLGEPLQLTARGLAGAHTFGYQWQRLVGGQWADLPGDTLVTKTWGQATAAEQGTYRLLVHDHWFTDNLAAPTELSSPPIFADLLPYAPLARNRPDDANQGPALAVPAIAPDALARGQDMNFVRTWTPRQALTQESRVARAPVDSVAMSTTYLDGLGRPVQTVLRQASPGRRDLVQPQAYDALGREPRQYLPYADSVNGRGGYRYRAIADQQQFYYRTTLPGGGAGPLAPNDPTRGVARTGVAYSESLFEPSPLNRVVAQGAPGEAGQLTGGHASEYAERPNLAADSVPRFVPGYDPARFEPGLAGCYAAGELWGRQRTDEHGHQALDWTDKQGRVVLRQVEAGPAGPAAAGPRRWLRTAYAYDDFGRLQYVLPPEATRRLPAAGPPPASGPGSISREEWANVPGHAVGDIPLTQPPTSTGLLLSLEGPTNAADNYGDRIRGLLVAPQTGEYRFWVAGDDNCEFWLSPDADPAHQQRRAYVPGWTYPREWTRYPQQASGPVRLVAGQRYSLAVLHKEGGGGDAVAVTWQLPDGTGYGAPIPGAFLLPYAPAAAAPITPYVFRYRYDGRGRPIARQVPGTDGETLVVFDPLDRPVLSQDAAQRGRREWSWTKYDALGRGVLSGLVIRGDTAGQVSLQALADANATPAGQYEQRTADGARYPHFYTTDQAFPRLGQQGFGPGTVLNATYYDDYNFDNDAAGVADATYDTRSDGQFPAGTAPVADALRTTGMSTRTKTRVLGVDPADPVQAAWLTTTTFYDERARPVQVQATNARQGLDLLTTRRDFPGQVVQSVAVHEGPNHAPLAVAGFFTYDHAGRLLRTGQQLPGEARAARIDSVAYNELGQSRQKTMGTGRLEQQVDYAYHIRGWLTQLNDPCHPVAGDLFNLRLHYETGFSRGYEQYNGNLTGQTWRGRDGVQRAYGYVYDPLNRLLQGDFVARNGPAPATPSVLGLWKSEEDNYRLYFASYDDNGNLLTLRRRGLLANATQAGPKQYGPVDALRYAYAGNRLQAVDDAVNTNQLPRPRGYEGAPPSLAGDFQEGGTHLNEEYVYDANGSLTQDRNKGISGIAYNHLNLPRLIHFGLGADSLVFRYSAAGQKVAKLVYQTGQPVRRTDYLGPFQYEQDSLRFFPHAEGRVLRFANTTSGAVRYEREFTFQDHLGNLRLAYRLGQVRTYAAGLEPGDAARETQQFDSLSVSAPVAQAVGALARTGRYAARLNAGGPAPQPLGPLAQLTVQQGDTVTVTAPGYYPQPVRNGRFTFSLASFVAGLLQPPVGAPRADGRRGGLPLLSLGISAALPGLVQAGGGVPKGYVRLLVFDADSNLVGSQTQQLSQAARAGYESLQVQVIAPQDGYVTAYVGNESPADVYFDDVRVEHRQGLQVQETHYDPTGLELAGLGGTSPGLKTLSQYKWNGKEFQPDLGLNWNHQDWRFFDAQLGRWHVTDPEIENGQESWTPYSFGFDNAVRYADADGRFPILAVAIGAAVGAGIEYGVEVATNLVESRGHIYASTFTEGAVDGRKIALAGVAGGVGALTGAVFAQAATGATRIAVASRLAMSSRTAAKVISGGIKVASELTGDAVSSVVGNTIQGKEVTAAGTALDVAGGLVGRRVQGAAQTDPKGQILKRAADRTKNIASGVNGRPTRQAVMKAAEAAYSGYGAISSALASGGTSAVVSPVLDYADKKHKTK